MFVAKGEIRNLPRWMWTRGVKHQLAEGRTRAGAGALNTMVNRYCSNISKARTKGMSNGDTTPHARYIYYTRPILHDWTIDRSLCIITRIDEWVDLMAAFSTDASNELDRRNEEGCVCEAIRHLMPTYPTQRESVAIEWSSSAGRVLLHNTRQKKLGGMMTCVQCYITAPHTPFIKDGDAHTYGTHTMCMHACLHAGEGRRTVFIYLHQETWM
jgi:hypothetical protein